ncbi:MAG: extracellular substrate binding-like orphan protein GrrP [Synechococcus sp. BS301-5m-G54]|nr:extracellular substrate binding-like orphan protein GrrP [Synechococcus sp. BS301-5m-G54]MBL6796131.1 extracellular substrate binding-like orphan protein GrrP [Synechococcus sp. BS307-5m-G34]
MRALTALAPAAAMLAMVAPLAFSPTAKAESTTLKAVIFEEVNPLYRKTDGGYEGLGVDILEQIRIQARRRNVSYRVASSVKDGVGAVISGKADIACGVAFTWGRATQLSYSLPFAIGGTRLLTAFDTTVDGTPDSLKGQTVGVVEDTPAANVLKSVAPGVTLKTFKRPDEALDAYNKGEVPILGGGTLWLAANSSPNESALLPFRPYARSGIGCIVNQKNGKLLSSTNVAIGQMMQAYMDGDAGTRRMIDRWIGPDSNVGLTQQAIKSLYGLILSTTAEISTSVDPGS